VNKDSKISIDKDRIRRKKPEDTEEKEPKKVEVSAGAIERIIDLAFNPSREKIREVTSVDRIQARLLPQLDIVDIMWQYAIETAAYRQSPALFKQVYKRKQPSLPSLIEDFIYRTAQWQKSVQGMNLKSAIDLALAETEARTEEGETLGGFDED